MTTQPGATQSTLGKAMVHIKDLLLRQESKIGELIPRHMSAARLLKVALNSIAKTSRLQECSASSLLQCVITAAELGLEPGGALGGAYLVPFKGVCTLIIGYRGFVDLARRSGELADIEAHVVREGEVFQVERGLVPIFRHVPEFDDSRPVVRVYCLARLRSGEVHAEVMSKVQVDKIRARSRSANEGPWVTDYEEMAKKTVIRRAAKLLPLSSERLSRALEHDDQDFVDSTATRVDDDLDSDIAGEVVSATASRARDAVKRKAPAAPPPPAPAQLPQEAATSRARLVVDVPEGMSEEEAAALMREPPADMGLPGQGAQ